MGKIKESEYTEYKDELLDDDDEDIFDPDMSDDDKEDLLDEQYPGYKRTWRDAEKYKEMRELYRIINDDLYTGLDENEIQGLDGQ